MIQNLKVDLIYHSTSSDFEMEFNLCGCCRMRLLSDKTTDKKGFVKALARDVARSRIIIACGPIFGEDGLISIVGTAIGNGVALCDNKTYGINSDEPIHIINGSTPLVTPDGYFGGCIIESGPQTIILLTENRTFRKAIMQTLIHPYIEEISLIPSKPPVNPEAPAAPEEFETAVAENEEYITTDEDYSAAEEETPAAPEPAPQEHNIEFIMDGETEEEAANEEPLAAQQAENTNENDVSLLMYTEVETAEEIKSRYENPYEPSESDKMFIASPEADDDSKPAKKRSKKRKGPRGADMAIIVLLCLLLLAILALVYFLVIRPMSMGISSGQYIKEIFGLVSETTSV